MDNGFDANALSAMNDEEIVDLAQKGDSGAIDFILRKYMAQVKRIANRYFIVGAEHDDIVQEGMIGLYKAVRSYEFGKNTSFRSFAELCINRNILTAIKGAMRQKHQPLNSYISLDRPAFDEDNSTLMDVVGRSEAANPEEIIINRETFNSIGDRIIKYLSRLECQVLLYYLRGESYTDIAQRLGKEPKAIDNAIQRIRRKFEKIAGHDGEL